ALDGFLDFAGLGFFLGGALAGRLVQRAGQARLFGLGRLEHLAWTAQHFAQGGCFGLGGATGALALFVARRATFFLWHGFGGGRSLLGGLVLFGRGGRSGFGSFGLRRSGHL